MNCHGRRRREGTERAVLPLVVCAAVVIAVRTCMIGVRGRRVLCAVHRMHRHRLRREVGIAERDTAVGECRGHITQRHQELRSNREDSDAAPGGYEQIAEISAQS